MDETTITPAAPRERGIRVSSTYAGTRDPGCRACGRTGHLLELLIGPDKTRVCQDCLGQLLQEKIPMALAPERCAEKCG